VTTLDPAVRDLLEAISRAVDGNADWRAVAIGSAVDRVLAGLLLPAPERLRSREDSFAPGRNKARRGRCAPMTDTRRCGCGCGATLAGRRRHATFASEACRLRAWRKGAAATPEPSRRPVTRETVSTASSGQAAASNHAVGRSARTWPELAAAALAAHPDTAAHAAAWTQGGVTR